MKIAMFTDIHGNYQALKAIISDIKKKKYDDVIFLGDAIGLGVDSNKCLNYLYKYNIRFLLGNHELYYTRGCNIIKTKKPEINEHNIWVSKNIKTKLKEDNNFKYVIKHNGKKILFVHFFMKRGRYPYENTEIFDTEEYKKYMNNTKYDYMFYGHLHQDRVDIINNKIFCSLGSSGCTKDDNTFYYVLNLDEDITYEKVMVKYNREKFVNRIKSVDFPNKKEILKDFYGIN